MSVFTRVAVGIAIWRLLVFSGAVIVAAPQVQDPPASPESPLRLTILQTQIGFNGVYKVGHWCAVRVEIAAASEPFQGRLRALLPDDDGNQTIFESQSFRLSDREKAVQTVYVKPARVDGPLEVQLITDQGVAARRRFATSELPDSVRTGRQVVLSIGSSLPIDRALDLRAGARTESVVHHRVKQANELPNHILGYHGIDVVVMATGDNEVLDQWSDEQRMALRRWVELGGSIIVCGASRGASMFAEQGPLAWVVPGRFDSVYLQQQTAGIEQYSRATRRLDISTNTDSSFRIPMLEIREPLGSVEVWEGLGATRLPAIVRHTVGLGRVVFVAFDLEKPPFAGWPDQSRLVAQLMDLLLDPPLERIAGTGDIGPVAHMGYTDLVGQLRHALDQFPGVRWIPFTWIASLIAGYIAIVGPLDYLLLRRWQRLPWTWFTFLVTVAGFTGLTIWLVTSSKGRELRLNQVNLVDIDVSSGICRGTQWAHLFTPRAHSWRLHLDPSDVLSYRGNSQQLLSWQGLPGEGFRGLDRQSSGSGFGQQYEIITQLTGIDEADGFVQGLPLATWSSRSLLGSWWGHVSVDSRMNAELTAGAESLVRGTLTNPLPIELREALLIFDRWAYPLGILAAGERRVLDESATMDLQAMLTRRRVVRGQNMATPWDQETMDVARIMQLLMFSGAAEGASYTRLQHRFQRSIDMSDHVTMGRCVLLGRSPLPLAELLVDGESVAQKQDWTYCRVLLPVKQRGNERP
jgi:hypothetical protein